MFNSSVRDFLLSIFEQTKLLSRALLEKNDIKSLRANPLILRQIIRRSMQLKISVVSEDKFESDKRMILNYGHTIGHGIEYASKERLLHGECVSIGIVLANELA